MQGAGARAEGAGRARMAALGAAARRWGAAVARRGLAGGRGAAAAGGGAPGGGWVQPEPPRQQQQPWGGSPSGGPGATAGAEPAAVPAGGVRAFVGYNVYKGKAALQFSPVKAQFAPFTDRQGQAALRLERKGSILCQFAPAAGERQYDWEKKQTFALSADELGSLLAMDAFKDEVSFFHDPNMGGQGQGLVQKALKVAPSPDGKVLFFSLDVKSGGGPNQRVSVPVSRGEFAVLCSLIHSVLPSLLGWDLWRDFVHLGTDAEKQRLQKGQEREGTGGFSDPPPF